MPKHGGVHASETMAVEETKRRFIIDMFVHAADVGNPGKEWTAGKSWSYLVMDEFWCQVRGLNTSKVGGLVGKGLSVKSGLSVDE
jgi:hypothetical protein